MLWSSTNSSPFNRVEAGLVGLPVALACLCVVLALLCFRFADQRDACQAIIAPAVEVAE